MMMIQGLVWYAGWCLAGDLVLIVIVVAICYPGWFEELFSSAMVASMLFVGCYLTLLLLNCESGEIEHMQLLLGISSFFGAASLLSMWSEQPIYGRWLYGLSPEWRLLYSTAGVLVAAVTMYYLADRLGDYLYSLMPPSLPRTYSTVPYT